MLETTRLLIRKFTKDDLNDLHEMNSNPEVMKYIFGRPLALEESQKYLDIYFDTYQKYPGLGNFAAFEKETKKFIGWVCLRPYPDDNNEIEIGYRLNKQSWGKGYASELAQKMVDYGFHQMKLKEIMAIVNPENAASKNVLAKAGLKYIKNIDFELEGKTSVVEYWKINSI